MAQNREKDETLELKVPTESPLSLSCPENSCKNLPSAAPSSSGCSGCGSVGPGIGPDPARVDRGAQGARPRSGEAEAPDQPGPAQVVEERKRTATEEAGSGGETAKRAVNRCSGCRKRVGLTGFRCRCGDLFCAEHRYSDRHECSYDYKTAGRAAIARENPVVRAAKILKV